MPTFSKISRENKFEFKHFLSLGLLDALKYCSSIFNLNINDPFIIALIDNVFEFLDSNDNSIKTYLNYWNKKSEKIYKSRFHFISEVALNHLRHSNNFYITIYSEVYLI